MEFDRQTYDCEGPLGFPMKDKQATQLESLLKDLPRDELFAPGRLVVEKATTELLEGERADVSWISTEDVDRYKDIVISSGMNDDHYKLNPIVTLGHSYWSPPAGRSLWRKRVKDGSTVGIKAKTVYPTRPESLPADCVWTPDEVFPLVQAGLLNGKSIGFIPTRARYPTDKEAAQGIRRVVEEWLLIEYACCYLPCNQTSIVEAVSKGLVIPSLVQKALGIDLKEVPPASPLVVPFTSLGEVEAYVRRHLQEIDFDQLANNLWNLGYAKARGKI
jgi:hypothetical protein